MEKILSPEKRICHLSLLNSRIELDTTIAARTYYRTGREMINIADVYFKENKLEQAYLLYMRFMTLFLNDIKEHPDYRNVPIEERQLNNQLRRDAFQKIEKIKVKLFEKYNTEYEMFMEIKVKALQEFKENYEKMKEKGNVQPEFTDNVIDEILYTYFDYASIHQSNDTKLEHIPTELRPLFDLSDNTGSLGICTHSNSQI